MERGAKKKKKQAKARIDDQGPESSVSVHSLGDDTADFNITMGVEDGEEEEEEQQLALEGDFISLFVQPLARDDFFRNHWERRALHIRGGGRPRFDAEVLNGLLCDLHVPSLVEASPSEQVHVWLRSAGNTSTVESFKGDADVALAAHRAGASLYFRAPEEISRCLVESALLSLGAGPFGWQPDGSVRGEVETFVSQQGHVTDWHYDFMENFTFQLRGRKRWLLKQSGVDVPLRGCTPHYNLNQGVIEMQMATARLGESNAGFTFVRPTAGSDGVSIVELEAGDVFYFPSGMYHRVECLDDSISINVSLEPCKFAEYLEHAATHAMRRVTDLRRHMVTGGEHDLHTRAATMLAAMKEAVNALTVDMLLPPAMLESRSIGAATVASTAEDVDVGFEVNAKTVLKRNPLASIMESADLYRDKSDAASFIIHFNTGNEEFVPWLRSELVPHNQDALRALRGLVADSQQSPSFMVQDKARVKLCKHLIHRGYLIPA